MSRRTDTVTKILHLELLTKLTFLTKRFLKIKCNEIDKLLITSHIYTKIYYLSFLTADACGRADSTVNMRPLACWDCRFESTGDGVVFLERVLCVVR